MARRKNLMGGLAKQISLSAYQHLVPPHRPQQVGGFTTKPISRQRHLEPSMPEYWHAMCNKLVGSMPRMPAMTQPDASSRKLNRIRRNLMKPPPLPKQTINPNTFNTIMSSYMQPQRTCQPSSKWGHNGVELPKEYGLVECQMPVSPSTGFKSASCLSRSSSVDQTNMQFHQHQQQQHRSSLYSPFNFGKFADNFIDEEEEPQRPSIQTMYAKVIEHQPQEDHQPKEFTPVSILKKRTHSEAGLELPGYKQAKVMNIVRHMEPNGSREPGKRPLTKSTTCINPRCKFSEPLIVKAPNKTKTSAKTIIKGKSPPIPKKPQQRSQMRTQQEQPQRWHSLPVTTFNFGKCASHYLERFSEESDSESIMYKAANAMGQQQGRQKNTSSTYLSRNNSPVSSASSKNHQEPDESSSEKFPQVFRIMSTVPSDKLTSELPKKIVKVSSKRFLRRLAQRLESGNNTSTVTLTPDNVMGQREPVKSARSTQPTVKPAKESKPAARSLLDLDALKKLLRPVELPAPEPRNTSIQREMKTESREQVNLNELFNSNKLQNMEGNPLWDSLMRLVVHMCDSKENAKKTPTKLEAVSQKSRLSAGDGFERQPKQYSVYLLVSSDEEEENTTGHSTSSLPIEVKSSKKTVSYNNLTHKKTEYTEHCHEVYQQEHPKRKRRKRKQRAAPSNRFTDTYSCLSPEPIRRPLHWPKPDMSKPEKRAIRTRSSAKNTNGSRKKRSLSLALEQHQRSWRMYEEQPLNARALGKAYSRLLGLCPQTQAFPIARS